MNCANFTPTQATPPWMSPWPALWRVADALNASARLGAVVGVLLTTGCAGIERAPQTQAPPPAAPAATSAAAETQPAAPSLPTQAKPVERTSPADKAAAPLSKGPVKPAATPPVAAAPAKSETRTAAPEKPQAAAPLDLKSLENRLKQTQAIGVFTKLTLKNQIDALLDQFRAFYQGKLKTSLADLRRSYDMLVLKVLALLQDADPPLASAIAGSREAIWGILSNPAKFAAV